MGAGGRGDAPGGAGGLLYDLGSHLVDQALHLFGPVTSVYAELDRRRPGIAVDDDVFLALTHTSRRSLASLGERRSLAHDGPSVRALGHARRLCQASTPMDRKPRSPPGVRPDRPDWEWSAARAGASLALATGPSHLPSEPGAYPRYYAGVVASLRQARRRPSIPRTP